ncbi:MAG: response regulator [Verrucomicrobia bacterium]|nr:response regulator [Verrucomicrobiota bacterium]
MQRSVVVFSGMIAGLAGLAALRGLDPLDLATAGFAETSPWFYVAALGFGLLGAVIAIMEVGGLPVAWLALGTALAGAVSLALEPLGLGHGVEYAIAALFPGDVTPQAETMPLTVAFALIASGLAVPWLAVSRHEGRRVHCFALLGSLLGGIGITTLLGYALKMPVAYHWGARASLPPSMAVLVLFTGLTLLALAWREHHTRQSGAPGWLPVPVMAVCGMITLIFWAGLREREVVYLSTNAQIAINNFAGSINLEFEREAAALERMGRRWSVDTGPAMWESDAVTWMLDAPGARSLARVGPDGTTVWYYPETGNETLLAFNQFSQPERRQAFENAARTGAPVVSNSLDLGGQGPGFIICSPIYRANALAGFISAEFTYQQFLGTLDRRTKASTHHHCEIYIGEKRMYDSMPGLESPGSDGQALASVFTLQNRRVRIVMEPTAEYMQQNRRFLPELALAAGLGITLLLGLSVHLARTARASLRSAETSNRLLREENEERKRIEVMLKVSDERLRLALDATAISIFEWNLATGELHHGAGLWTMLGILPENATTTPEEWEARIHPFDLADYRAAVAAQLNGAQAFIDPSYRVRTAAGEWRWLYARSKTVAYTPAGEPTRIVGTLQDVSQRKEAEQALRRSQAAARKLSLVASRTDNLVLISAPDGAIEWVNESFQRVMGYTLDEVMGKKPADFMVGPETSALTVRDIQAAIARGEGISTDVVNYSKSGRKHHLQLEIQPVRNEQGVLENFIAIEADITARVETEAALRRAKAEADATSRAKSEFLASVSHEIRTPMNGVIGMTSLLLETALDHDQRDSVNTIRASGEALLTIINDILDFSKIESGKLEIEHQLFELSTCIEETIDLFAAQAAARRIEVCYHIDEKTPPLMLGDAIRLRQVLGNLVNNAIKFTSRGSVSIEISPAVATGPLRPRHQLFAIAVRDTGIGIPADRLNRLFKPFSQVDSSTTRKYGGTGLGLAICQRLSSLMGGDIQVESEIGRGSAFTVTLQLESAAAEFKPSRSPLPAALTKGPVLCIDDNPVTLRRLTAFFQSAGLDVRTASTAGAALELLRQPSAPVAALLDLDLPDVGTIVEALARLKLPVVGLLPSNQVPAPAWNGESPFIAISKPLRTQGLIRALHVLFPGDEAKAAPAVSADTLLLSKEFPLAVLLVEDNPVNQKVALRFLERLGYRADAVANGVEAVAKTTQGSYQLVLMDLQMPEMDGFEAARQIRKLLPAARQPRIVALTANALQSDRDHCIEAGMDDFITKPIKLTELSDAIRRQFGKNPDAKA